MDLGNRSFRFTTLALLAAAAPIGCHSRTGGPAPTQVFSTVSFTSRHDIPVGTGATQALVRELDGDNLKDILVTRFQDGQVTLLRTHFDGSSPTAVNLPVGPTLPIGVDAADIDSDDRDDVVVTDSATSQVYVYRNDGNGAFTLMGAFPTCADPFAVTLADWNQDGVLDVAVGGITSRDVRIHRGLKPFDFDAGFSIPLVHGMPVQLAARDLDADGMPDLLINDYSRSLVLLWRNTTTTEGGGGAISFDTTPEAPAPPSPFGMAIADVNGNGKLEIAVGSFGFPGVTIFEQDGFTLNPLALIPLPAPSGAVAFGDVNGDGKLDVAASLATIDGVAVALGDGAGNFGDPILRATDRGPLFLAVGDLDHDGRDDVVVPGALGGNLSVFDGTTVGGVNGPPSFFGGFEPRFLSAADLDGDGKPDFAIGDDATGQVRVFKNEGSLAFANVLTLSTSASAHRVVLVDVDADGDRDLAALHDDGLTLFRNEGGNNFVVAASLASGASLLDGLAADLTGDGKADVVASDPANSQLVIFKNNGSGLEFLFTVAAGATAAGVDVADLDNDGDLDLLVANNGAHTVSLARHNANGTFTANAVVLPTGPFAAHVKAGDVDGDGRRDVVVSHAGGNAIERFKNVGSFNFAAPDSVTTNGSPLGLQLADLNRDGRADLLYTESENGHACAQLGQNAGGFGLKILTMPTQYFVEDTLLVDLNGDTKLELVTSSQVSPLVNIHPNLSH